MEPLQTHHKQSSERIHALAATAIGVALVSTALPVCGQAVDPHDRPDETWITIHGTATDIEDDEFTLDYGNGTIPVEMDDGDMDADASHLIEGDAVSVSGVVDDDFFERASIEAGAVYVERLGMTFRTSTIDDEDLPAMHIPARHVVSQAFVQGTITEIADETFTIDRGDRAITVSVVELDYDPFDDEGFQHLRVGDRVIVTGANAYGPFVGPRLFANRIVLFRAARRSAGAP